MISRFDLLKSRYRLRYLKLPRSGKGGQVSFQLEVRPAHSYGKAPLSWRTVLLDFKMQSGEKLVKNLFNLLLALTTISALLPVAAKAQAGLANMAPSVEAQVGKLQWRRSVDPDTEYHDVSGTLYVVEGTGLVFRAVRDDESKSWPPNTPAWSGSSGASGTGVTTPVTFSTVSNTSTDYKTVIAQTTSGEHSDAQTANVIVSQLTPKVIPDVDFPTHSKTRFGIAETAACSADIAPAGVSSSQLGGLEWEKVGAGDLSDSSGENAKLNCGILQGAITLHLVVLGGPSKDKEVTLNFDVVTPNAGYVDNYPGTSIRHSKGLAGVAAFGLVSIGPKDVSFDNVKVREGGIALPRNLLSDPPVLDTSILGNVVVAPTTSGPGDWWNAIGIESAEHWSISENYITHGSGYINIESTPDNIDSGSYKVGDTSPYDSTKTIPSYAAGTFSWKIPWFYKATGGTWTKFADITQTHVIDASGKMTATKSNLTASASLNDDDSGF